VRDHIYDGNPRRCDLWFCDEEHYARGYCATHYQNWRRFGTPLPPRDESLRRVLTEAQVLAGAAGELVADPHAGTVTHDTYYVCLYCGVKTPKGGSSEAFHKHDCPIYVVRQTLAANQDFKPTLHEKEM
jgi:hypothetical protein